MRIACRALVIALLAGAGLHGEEMSLGGLEQDLGFLAGRIAQNRSHLKRSSEGEAKLSELESGLNDCRSGFDRLKEMAGNLDTAEGHVRYFRNMEVEPKQNAIKRIQANYKNRADEFNQRKRNLKALCDAHDSRPHVFAAEDAAGLAAYNQEAADLTRRIDALNREGAAMQQRYESDMEAAMQAAAKALAGLMEEE